MITSKGKKNYQFDTIENDCFSAYSLSSSFASSKRKSQIPNNRKKFDAKRRMNTEKARTDERQVNWSVDTSKNEKKKKTKNDFHSIFRLRTKPKWRRRMLLLFSYGNMNNFLDFPLFLRMGCSVRIRKRNNIIDQISYYFRHFGKEKENKKSISQFKLIEAQTRNGEKNDSDVEHDATKNECSIKIFLLSQFSYSIFACQKIFTFIL